MLDAAVPVEVVRHFCQVATARLGVGFDDGLQPLVAGRVAKRLRALRLDPEEYLRRLDDDPECNEVVGFLDFLRPRPPRFFARRDDHLALHAGVVRWIREGNPRIRLWSAGCGTGEEAYGMALTVLAAVEAAGVGLHEVNIKILASDISRPILERGKQGVFAEEQLRDVPRAAYGRYFRATQAGMAIDEDVRDMVCFRRLNLTSIPFPMSGPFRGIFCRQGLEQMVPSARRRVTSAMKALLAQRGLLCIGSSTEVLATEGGEDDQTSTVRFRFRSGSPMMS